MPLAGGSVTTVVRVGDTVRRTTDRWSPAVHAVLRHLEAAGFDGAPRLLGRDERDREILTWIEGTPATRPWPPALRTDDGLAALGRLLRGAHDALRDFRPAGAEWVTGSRDVGPDEIVCHGDPGPWNTLWRDGEPVAFIDWDFAQPMPPVHDLAQVAFFTTPMRDDAHCRECGFDDVPDRRHRLAVVCDAYGDVRPSDVVDAAEAWLVRDLELMERHGPAGTTPWAGFLARDLPASNRRLVAWVREHRRLLL